jgi:hypothetical protein
VLYRRQVGGRLEPGGSLFVETFLRAEGDFARLVLPRVVVIVLLVFGLLVAVKVTGKASKSGS